MKGVSLVVLVALALCASEAQAAPFSDQLCPEATHAVIAVQALTTGADPATILRVARDAAAAYDGCAVRMLGDQNIEPGAHYARTRQAQFEVLAARAETALGRHDDARRDLLQARGRASDVASWEVSAHGVDPGVQTKSDSRYSRFRDTALAVVSAAEAELKKAEGAAPSPSPKP